MLVPAFYHKDKLNAARAKVFGDPNYRFASSLSYYEFEATLPSNSWAQEQYVSLDADGAVVGYLSAQIDRETDRVTNLCISRFVASPVFSLDLLRFLRLLKRFRIINWSVIVGCPAEPVYDRLCQRMGGRIVGVFAQCKKLTDGKVYDEKWYEVLIKP